MADYIKGVKVSLSLNIKEEEFERVKTAIEMIKGVINVEPIHLTSDDHIVRMRVENEFKEKLFNALK